MNRSQLRMAFAGCNAAFGVLFLLAPRLSLRLYGLDPERDARASLALRYFGSRSLLLAALLSNEDGATAVLEQLPVVAAMDGFAISAAAVTGEVPKRTALLAAASSAMTLALGFGARR